MSSKVQRIVAVVVSQLTSPVLIAGGSLAVVTFVFARESGDFIRFTLLGWLLLLGPGIFYAIYIWIKERRIDFDISDREDRIVPLLCSTFGAVIGSFLISSRLDDPRLLLISYVLVSMLILLTLITFFWKISLHAATSTAAIMLLILFQGFIYSWLLLIVPLIWWARLTLKQHTPAQLAAGTMTGLSVTVIAWLLFQT